jgi:hypothetical protein
VYGISNSRLGGNCVSDNNTRRKLSNTSFSNYLLADLRNGNIKNFAKTQNYNKYKSNVIKYNYFCIRTYI